MKIHVLQTPPRYFEATARGDKSFEIRFNDRDYQVGDMLVLYCWRPDFPEDHPKEALAFKVKYMTEPDCQFLPPGVVAMGLDGGLTHEEQREAVRAVHVSGVMEGQGEATMAKCALGVTERSRG